VNQIERGRKRGEMLVGDIVIWRDEKFGLHRFWEVEAVVLDSEKEEGLIRLRSLNYKPGHDEFGNAYATTLVPEALLRNAEIFMKSNHSK
jgi:hypothetical protein